MMYLTLDRLFDILLNIKYPVFWNERRTVALILITWCLSLTCAVAACFVQYHTNTNVYDVLDLYVYPSFGVVFIVIATITYLFIFRKYKQSCLPPVIRYSTSSGGSTISRMSTLQIFQRSRFYIP